VESQGDGCHPGGYSENAAHQTGNGQQAGQIQVPGHLDQSIRVIQLSKRGEIPLFTFSKRW
jgi:hypothetical protein